MQRDCDACQGIEPVTPQTVANRPGLPALRYRAGTHGSFLESMIARLSTLGAEKAKEQAQGNPDRRQGQSALPPSTWLRSREPADPTIAMLDAWSTVGDILTFYQERIANEGYLSTAFERRSLHELANLVGYKLRPALSSSVYLAFDVQPPPALDREVPPAPPHEVLIPKGTQARHIPGPGELPQVFETKEDLIARPEWNQLKPRMTKPIKIEVGGDSTFGSAHEIRTLRFDRMDHNIKTGDYLLLVQAAVGPQTPLSLIRQIESITFDRDRKQTVVHFVESNFSLTRYRDTIIASAQTLLTEFSVINLRSSFADRRSKWVKVASEVDQVFDGGKTLLDADLAVWDKLRELSHPQMKWDELAAAYEKVNTPITLFPKEGGSLISTTWSAIKSGKDDCAHILRDSLSSASQVYNFLTHLVASANDLEQGLLSDVQIEEVVSKLNSTLALQNGTATTRTTLESAMSSLKQAAEKAKNHMPYLDDVREAFNLCSGGKSQQSVKGALMAFSPEGTVRRALDGENAQVMSIELPNSGLSPNEWNERCKQAARIIDKLAALDGVIPDSQIPLVGNARADVVSQGKLLRKNQLGQISSRVKDLPNSLYDNLSPEDRDKLKTLLPDVSPESSILAVVEKVFDTHTKYTTLAKDIIETGAALRFAVASGKKMLKSWNEASVPFAKGAAATLAASLLQLVTRGDDATAPRGVVSQMIEDISAEVLRSDYNAGQSRIRSVSESLKELTSGDPKDIVVVKTTVSQIKGGMSAKFSPSVQASPIPLPGLSGADTLGKSGLSESLLGRADGASSSMLMGNSDFVTRTSAALGGTASRDAIRFWGGLRVNDGRGKVFAFRTRASLFGSQQPQEIATLTVTGDPAVTRRSSVEDPITHAESDESEKVLFLDHDYTDITADSWCIIGTIQESKGGTDQSKESLSMPPLRAFQVKESQLQQRSAYLVSGKTTRLVLNGPWQPSPPTERKKDENTKEEEKEKEMERVVAFRKRLRSTVVIASSIELPIADDVLDDPFPDPASSSSTNGTASVDDADSRGVVELDEFYGDLSVGQRVILSGEVAVRRPGVPQGLPAGTTLSHACTIIAAVHSPDPTGSRVETKLFIDPPLGSLLVRFTVRIYANVVEATNGSTVTEVIGNGEGQGQFQRFLLSQPRLTYLPAETPTGMKPELEVRVNSVEWNQAENVGDLQPVLVPGRVVDGEPQRMGLPRKYLTSVDDDQKTFLTTGDGVTTGERLPTGITNVRATYRVGGGKGGNVKEGTITQLASPPLNVTKVRNLMPASGGVDRENVDQARKNLPVAVMALDRLVSVTDYESFARKFAGIAKAQATLLSLDGRVTVVVTIAALDDQTIDKQSLLYKNLEKALRKFADPEQSVIVEPRELMLLMTNARIKVEDGYRFEDVKVWVRDRILKRFDFEKAQLGESVLLSDLIETIQNTRGVRYVDVDMFDRMRQFYGTAQMVAHATAISRGIGRKFDAHRPEEQFKQPRNSIRFEPARKNDGEVIYLLDSNAPDDLSKETLSRVKVPQSDSDGVTVFPAQLAYFTDLAGTILLEEIK